MEREKKKKKLLSRIAFYKRKHNFSLRRLVAAPAPVPAAAAGAVGVFPTASVVVGRLASTAEIASPPAGHTPGPRGQGCYQNYVVLFTRSDQTYVVE
jgi:hypothetical protein